MTVGIAETVAGKQNVLHFDFAARHRHRTLQRPADPTSSNKAGTTRTSSPSAPAALTKRWRPTTCRSRSARASPACLRAKLRQAAEWAYKPKAGGARPRTVHAYEKGIIWGNDNYLIQSALVDLVLATYNVGGRRGTGVVRMGGHQEGYTRPPHPDRRKDLRRPGAHQGQRPHDDLVGLQQLPDEQQRAAIARGGPRSAARS